MRKGVISSAMKHFAIRFLLIPFAFATLKTSAQKMTEEKVKCEGFYTIGWETSTFNRKRSDDVILSHMWLSFADSVSLNGRLGTGFTIEGFMSVEGIRKTGGSFGHLGSADSQIVVTRILWVDTTFTLNDFFHD